MVCNGTVDDSGRRILGAQSAYRRKSGLRGRMDVDDDRAFSGT